MIGETLVVSPTFMGAEPNVIDEGPLAGLTILDGEESAGLRLMRSLPSALRDRAQIYKHMYDPAMPPRRFHPADQRHLAGAFHDNLDWVSATPRRHERHALSVRRYADAAVIVGGLTNYLSEADGGTRVIEAMVTQVAQRQAGVWRFVAFQITPKR